MTPNDCVGEGSGWGTIDGARLRILILTDPRRREDARRVVHALAMRHAVETSSEDGIFRSLVAARAARALSPHLIHAVGLRGAAKSAPLIASGMNIPYVLSLNGADIDDLGKMLEIIERALAVLLENGTLADRLRSLGVDRELYVLSIPENADDDASFLGALEIVYGRVLAGTESNVELETNARLGRGEAANANTLVKIGRKHG